VIVKDRAPHLECVAVHYTEKHCA